jgi:putative membrane protein
MTPPAFSWTRWEFHPSTLIGVAALGLLYAWLLGPLRSRLGAPAGTTGQRVAFGSALALILLVLNGPLHDLAEGYLFSAHMVQHLVLTLAVAPLLLAGVPGWVVERAIRPRAVAALGRFLTRPLIAFLLPSLVLGVWHFPGPYDAALASHAVHIPMHLTLLASAVMLWWPVLSPTAALPRLHPAGQLVYLFLLGFPMSLVGALISLAERPLYAGYLGAPRLFGLDVVGDQKLGGLIMWVPGMLVFWGAMTVVWFRWAAAEEREEGRGKREG